MAHTMGFLLKTPLLFLVKLIAVRLIVLFLLPLWPHKVK